MVVSEELFDDYFCTRPSFRWQIFSQMEGRLLTPYRYSFYIEFLLW